MLFCTTKSNGYPTLRYIQLNNYRKTGIKTTHTFYLFIFKIFRLLNAANNEKENLLVHFTGTTPFKNFLSIKEDNLRFEIGGILRAAPVIVCLDCRMC